jgi:broad specificity phosphatase PhoE
MMRWTLTSGRHLALAILTIVSPGVTGVAWGQAPLRAVIIVRHGEKATAPKENPPLSPAGEARARALLETLRDAGVTTVITTDQIRTRATAAPLLATLRLRETIVPRTEDPHQDAGDVATAIRRAGGTVLVVSHQLTMPQIIAALGGPKVATVCDVEFSNLYTLLPRGSSAMQLIRSHYGEPDPPHAEDCHITPVSPP